jgi:flagellar hook-associated protein 3 FlgL
MSSAFRVTQKTVSATMMNGLQSNLGRMQRLQEQLSSGKQVSRPSDSPVKTVEAMQLRAEIRRTEQYVRNSDDGLALLTTADSALTSSLDMTRRVRDLVLTGMNDTTSAEGRAAIAAEVDTLIGGLLGVANTRYLDRPVFGGTTSGTTAYDESGAYLGDERAVERTIAAGTRVPVGVVGPRVFGDPTVDQDALFAVLTDIRNALTSGGSGNVQQDLTTGLARLDGAIDRIITTLGELGARSNRVERMRTAAEDQLLGMTHSLSEAEDIDLPKTIIDLQMQEVSYKAALGATARVVQPSLLDFLR